MSREEILRKIEEILRDEFEEDELEITFDTKAADVEGWDSLAHLSIIHEIESEFDIKFTMGEIQGAQNVGELIDYFVKHLEEK